MAVVTPLLLTLVFGIIEFSWMMSVQQTITNAAREGGRTAVLRGTTDQEIRDRVNAYMNPSGLTSHKTSVVRATVMDPTETVTVSLYYGDISLVGGFFPGLTDRTLTATCAMRQEGAGAP
jgi:Flp pilus assembly protein TadG